MDDGLSVTLPSRTDPAGRDRAVRVTRFVAWVTGLVAAGLSALLSVVSAHAFKGHDGKAHRVAHRVVARVRVPGPQFVPGITGAPAPLQPPQQPPAVAPSEQPAPETSGGS